MFESLDQVRDFLGWCRSNGVLKIRVGEVEADLLPRIPHQPSTDEKPQKRDPRTGYTEDELFGAVEG